MFLFLLLFGVLNGFIYADREVAFVCGKPAMYMDDSGTWNRYPVSTCVHTVFEALEFCKKMYPKANISHAIPSGVSQTITGWCDNSVSRCNANANNTHVVYPFKCRSGTFIAEQLVIKPGCRYHTLQESSSSGCYHYRSWGVTAQEKCANMAATPRLHSFALAAPCVTTGDAQQQQQRLPAVTAPHDHYGGVTFMCCPPEKETKSDGDGVGVWAPKGAQKPIPEAALGAAPSARGVLIGAANVGSSHDKKKQPRTPLSHYMARATASLSWTSKREHHAYIKAKLWVERRLRNERQALLRELRKEEANVEKLMEYDFATASRLGTDVEQKYRGDSVTLEQIYAQEFDALVAEHQKRVRRRLDDQFHSKFQQFRKACVRDNEAAPVKPLVEAMNSALDHLYQDYLHAVNHANHVRQTLSGSREARALQTLRHRQRVLDARRDDVFTALKRGVTSAARRLVVMQGVGESEKFVDSIRDMLKEVLDKPINTSNRAKRYDFEAVVKQFEKARLQKEHEILSGVKFDYPEDDKDHQKSKTGMDYSRHGGKHNRGGHGKHHRGHGHHGKHHGGHGHHGKHHGDRHGHHRHGKHHRDGYVRREDDPPDGRDRHGHGHHRHGHGRHGHGWFGRHRLRIVLPIMCVTAVLIACLVAALFLVIRRRRRGRMGMGVGKHLMPPSRLGVGGIGGGSAYVRTETADPTAAKAAIGGGDELASHDEASLLQAMQTNGYENPTYKFFEATKPPPAKTGGEGEAGESTEGKQ